MQSPRQDGSSEQTVQDRYAAAAYPPLRRAVSSGTTVSLAQVASEVADALRTVMQTQPDVMNGLLRMLYDDLEVWRRRLEHVLLGVTAPYQLAPPVWFQGRPARWLRAVHPVLGTLTLTTQGTALVLYCAPLHDRSSRLLIDCPPEVIRALEAQP